MGYYIGSGQTSNNIVLNDDDMHITSGGVANSTTVNSWGYMYISSGGVANSTTVNDGGSMYISSGGVANSTTVNSWGYMHIYSGGVANSTTVNQYGKMYISSGGVANSTTFNGGSIRISSGGVANSTTVNDCGWMSIFSGGVANSTTVNYGYMDIFSGGVANSTTVNSDGHMNISSGGVANSTTVNSGGWMLISSGGTATDITAQAGARLDLTVASDTYIQGTYNGSAFEMRDAFISGYTVNSWGDMYISSGGVANSTTVSSRGYMYISSGGTATDITAQAGAWLGITVASDTYIQGTYNGSAFEMKDAFISGYTVNFNGMMEIGSGGVANSTTVNSSGGMLISSGGVASSTTVNWGDMYIFSGGVANSTTVNRWGTMHIDGVASNTTVNSDGGMSIFSGGVANSTTVNSGGYMWIDSGGVHRGSLNIKSGVVVSAYNGGIIDFTVAGRTVKDGYLINDLSKITGTPTYTVTVYDGQAYGTYKLAQGAANFTVSVTIGNGEEEYGSVTANGNAVSYNNRAYYLTEKGGKLNLVVSNDKYIFISSKYNEKITGKMQDGALLEYGRNAFTSIDAVGNIDNKIIILLDSKNSGNYFNKGTIAGTVSEPVIKETDNSYSYKLTATAKGTLNISQNTGLTEFIRFATVNVTGAKVGNITGGRIVSSEDDKSTVDRKGVVTSTDKTTYSNNAAGMFTAVNGSAGNVAGYSTIKLTGTNIGDVTGGNFSSNTDFKSTMDDHVNINGYDKVTSNRAAAGMFTASNGSAGNIAGYTTVNVTGATVGNVDGGKYSSSKDTKSTVDKKGTVTDTEKTSSTLNANGKFTANDGSAETVSGYATVNLTSATVTELSGGNTKNTTNSKLVDAAAKDQKTISTVDDSVAAGSVTLKNQANVDSIAGYSNVTLTDSTAGTVTNFTSKDSKSDTATYDEAKNTVNRKVTLSHTETTAGTLKATNSELGDVTGFATVTLKDVSSAGNFRRVDSNGNKYSTIKETLSVKTNKDGSVTGTYNKTETFTRTGKFTATGSTVGNIENFSNVTLDGSDAEAITNFVEAKAVIKYTVTWENAAEYGRPDDYALNFDLPTPEVTKSLNGSVTLKNGASASSITNFKSVTMTNSEVDGSITNVNKVTVNKGDSTIGSYTGTDGTDGTDGNDTLSIAKGAVLTAGEIVLTDAKDTLALNGTLILSDSNFNVTKITGKGEIAAAATVWDDLDMDETVLNLGETSEYFRGTAYENADDTWKKAVKWDGKSDYNGWLGDWSGAKVGSDEVDFIKFKATADTTLQITGDVDWLLLDKKGKEVDAITAAGDYIIQLENKKDESVTYTITLA